MRSVNSNHEKLEDALRELVRSLYRSRLLTQNQIARAANVPRSLLTAWLSGKRGITLRTASKLVRIVGLTRVGRFLEHFDSEAGRRRADALEALEQTRREMLRRAEQFDQPRSCDGGSNEN